MVFNNISQENMCDKFVWDPILPCLDNGKNA